MMKCDDEADYNRAASLRHYRANLLAANEEISMMIFAAAAIRLATGKPS